MPEVNQDVTVWQDNPQVLVFNCINKDGSIPDLSTATIKWWMGTNAYATGADVKIKKDWTSGVAHGIQPTVTPGQFAVTLSPGDTLNLEPGDYYHEAEVILADGTGGTASTGVFTLEPTIIR